jgi:hypothetical protein
MVPADYPIIILLGIVIAIQILTVILKVTKGPNSSWLGIRRTRVTTSLFFSVQIVLLLIAMGLLGTRQNNLLETNLLAEGSDKIGSQDLVIPHGMNDS